MQAVERELLEPGWRKIYKPLEDEHGFVPAGKGALATLEIGQRVRPKKVRAVRQSGLSEAGLIRAMREKGIGRPATYALIVQTLLTRTYVVKKERGQLALTPKGRQVYLFLIRKFPHLFAFTYTARMEAAIDGVAQGSLLYESAVQSVWICLSNKWTDLSPEAIDFRQRFFR